VQIHPVMELPIFRVKSIGNTTYLLQEIINSWHTSNNFLLLACRLLSVVSDFSSRGKTPDFFESMINLALVLRC
jgi:hypothetical protein